MRTDSADAGRSHRLSEPLHPTRAILRDQRTRLVPPTALAEPSAFADREELLELDEVVQKACATDPRQRYQSASEMHQDLLLLKAGKSVKRVHGIERRLAVLTRVSIAAAIILVAVVPGYLLALHERKQAQTNEKKARAEAAKSKQTAQFLQEMLQGVGP